MKVSVIISFYNSHGVWARQVNYFRRMGLPDDVEFIFVDDGSDPPFRASDYDLPGLRIGYTHNQLAWTQGLGRNLGAEMATGEYVLMTDADHILSQEAIAAVRAFDGRHMIFKRYFGVLLADGTLTQDLNILATYGLDVAHLKPWRGLYASTHGNTFSMRREDFQAIGGYTPETCTVGYHPISREGDDCYLRRKWRRHAESRGYTSVVGPDIYMYPIGRYHVRGETNPMGLFHNLSYDGKQRRLKGDELLG